MQIRTKLRISKLFSLCVALAAGIALFLILQGMNDAIERSIADDAVVKGVFELDTLTYEYLLNHEERIQAQWQLRYHSLSKILVLFSELIRPNLPDYNNPFTFVRPL